MGDELADVFRSAKIHVRGPKALGAVRALGFDAESMAADELTGTLVAELAPDLQGKSVVLQHHGYFDTEATAALLRAGATEVVKISPYRWCHRRIRASWRCWCAPCAPDPWMS